LDALSPLAGFLPAGKLAKGDSSSSKGEWKIPSAKHFGAPPLGPPSAHPHAHRLSQRPPASLPLAPPFGHPSDRKWAGVLLLGGASLDCC